ncbi:AprI/Inh family metalloprotease inhibitor [Devosia sp.]|uniref:AprI/Inh family metalloprotease inhibitor n=1 Tax=Devosia sp. TaxID=1871048 RepID=UPI002EE869A2
MTTRKRAGVPAAAIAALALLLTGCSSMSGQQAARSQPEQLQPIQDGTVASTDLPTIGGAPGTQPVQLGAPPSPGQVNPALTGQPVLGGGQPVPLTTADGGFVTLDSVGNLPATPGRDLTGGLTTSKLVGGWTIVSGTAQCKLYLTETAKAGTGRLRASTPGCEMPGLKVVASWQLAGSQVQLFDENGDMIAALILSGNRFIGTLAGGQGISMVG